MSLFKRASNYIKDNNFRMYIENKFIDLVNYEKIEKIDDNEIILIENNRKIVISGKSLTVNRLMSHEILVCGNFNNIKFEGFDE